MPDRDRPGVQVDVRPLQSAYLGAAQAHHRHPPHGGEPVSAGELEELLRLISRPCDLTAAGQLRRLDELARVTGQAAVLHGLLEGRGKLLQGQPDGAVAQPGACLAAPLAARCHHPVAQLLDIAPLDRPGQPRPEPGPDRQQRGPVAHRRGRGLREQYRPQVVIAQVADRAVPPAHIGAVPHGGTDAVALGLRVAELAESAGDLMAPARLGVTAVVDGEPVPPGAVRQLDRADAVPRPVLGGPLEPGDLAAQDAGQVNA